MLRRIIASTILLFAAVALAQAQTATITATAVTDASGKTIAAGFLCFSNQCLPVTAGAIVAGSTVPQGTYNIAVENGTRTVLTYQNIPVTSSTFNFDTFTLGAGQFALGESVPNIPATTGANYFRAYDSSAWTYGPNNGTTGWHQVASQPIAPSGNYSGVGAPTFFCTSPCSWVNTTATAGQNHYDLVANPGTVSANWIVQGGSGGGASSFSQLTGQATLAQLPTIPYSQTSGVAAASEPIAAAAQTTANAALANTATNATAISTETTNRIAAIAAIPASPPGAPGQGYNERGTWAANTAYNPYDVFSYNGQTYEVPTAFTSGSTFSATGLNLWAAAGAAGANGTNGTNGTNGASIAPPTAYAAGTTYAPYALVTYGTGTAATVYQAQQACSSCSITPGANPAYWLPFADAAGAAGAAGSASANAVLGATSLTTIGAIPEVSSNGVVGPSHLSDTGSVINNTEGYAQNGVGAFGGLTFAPVTLNMGDSITDGAYLMKRENAYGYRLASAWGGVPLNLGIPGDTTGGYETILFQYIPKTKPVINTLITYTMGTNNVAQGGTSTNQQLDYGLAMQSQTYYIELQGTPYFFNLQTSSAITYSGSWSNSTTFGSYDPGKICIGSACAATITFTGSVLEIATGLTNTNTMSATVTCDGTATGVTPLFTGVNGETLFQSQTAGFRVPLTTGSHVCVIQSTSSTGTLQLEWAAGLPGTSLTTRTLLLGSVPGHNTDTNYAPYRPYQQSAVAAVKGDGLQMVGYVDLSAVYPLQTNSFIDGATHPIDFNHYAMANAFVGVLNTLWGTSLIVPPPALPGSANAGGGFPTAGASTFNFGGNGLPVNTGNYNLACPGSGIANTTGSGNTFCGSGAGSANTTGNYLTVYGQNALGSSSTLSYATALGYNAFSSLTAGGGAVTAAGFSACSSVTTTSNAVCIGDYAGATYGSNIALTNSTAFTILGSKSGLAVADAAYTDWGVFGALAYVSGSHSYEIGAGTNSVLGTLAFRGNPFIDGSGNLTANNITINGTCTGCSTYANTPFNGLTGGTNTTAAMVLGSGASLSTSGTGTISGGTATALQSQGVPVGTLGSVSLTAQTAALGNTTIYTATAAGLYCAAYSLYMQVVGTAGNISLTLVGNDGYGAPGINAAGAVVTGIADTSGGEWCVHLSSGSSLGYVTTFNSVTGSPQYGLDIAVRRML